MRAGLGLIIGENEATGFPQALLPKGFPKPPVSTATVSHQCPLGGPAPGKPRLAPGRRRAGNPRGCPARQGMRWDGWGVGAAAAAPPRERSRRRAQIKFGSSSTAPVRKRHRWCRRRAKAGPGRRGRAGPGPVSSPRGGAAPSPVGRLRSRAAPRGPLPVAMPRPRRGQRSAPGEAAGRGSAYLALGRACGSGSRAAAAGRQREHPAARCGAQCGGQGRAGPGREAARSRAPPAAAPPPPPRGHVSGLTHAAGAGGRRSGRARQPPRGRRRRWAGRPRSARCPGAAGNGTREPRVAPGAPAASLAGGAARRGPAERHGRTGPRLLHGPHGARSVPWEAAAGGGAARRRLRAGGQLRAASGEWQHKLWWKDLDLNTQGRGTTIKRPGCKAPGTALTMEKCLREWQLETQTSGPAIQKVQSENCCWKKPHV